MTTFGVHYKALMRKNYTLWKRNKCRSCCEVTNWEESKSDINMLFIWFVKIGVPVALSLLFFVFRAATSRNVGNLKFLRQKFISNFLLSPPSFQMPLANSRTLVYLWADDSFPVTSLSSCRYKCHGNAELLDEILWRQSTISNWKCCSNAK